MIAEGNYQGWVESVATTTSGRGNPQLEIRFCIDEGTRRTIFLSLTDAAREKFVDGVLEQIGFNGDFANPTIAQEFYDDYKLEVYCKHEEYDGKTRERWAISSGDFQNEAAGDDVIARLNASWRATHKPERPAPAGKPSAPPAPKTPPAKTPPPKAPPAKSKQFGKDEAWTTIKDKIGATREIDVEEWHATIASVAGGNEDKFGEAEWRQVVENYLALPPF